MSAIDDYLSSGGLIGFAEKALEDEIRKALNDELHILRDFVNPVRNGNAADVKEFLSAIDASPENHPLKLIELVKIKIPLIQEMYRQGCENSENDDFLEALPVRVVQWVGMWKKEEKISKTNSLNAKNKRKPKAGSKREVKEKIIKLMRGAKKSGSSYKDFIRSLENSEIRMTVISEKYEFSSDDFDPSYGPVAEKTLMDWWSDCTK